MKAWALLVFLAVGLAHALADDPPGYPGALVGHVTRIVPEGLIVETVNPEQIRPSPMPPGVDHECFAFGGPFLIRGVRSKYRVGDRIEITVAEAQGAYILSVDPTHALQLGIYDLLNESVAFPVDVDWDPANPATNAASAAPATPAPTPAPATSTPSDFNPGSIDDDPLSPPHK